MGCRGSSAGTTSRRGRSVRDCTPADRRDRLPNRHRGRDRSVREWPRFAVLNRSTLPEGIADRLLVSSGPGAPARGQAAGRAELAPMLGVSRPVLREALRALSLMRVVDIRHGDGTYITSLGPRPADRAPRLRVRPRQRGAEHAARGAPRRGGRQRPARARTHPPRRDREARRPAGIAARDRRARSIRRSRHGVPRRCLRGGGELPPGAVHERDQHMGKVSRARTGACATSARPPCTTTG